MPLNSQRRLPQVVATSAEGQPDNRWASRYQFGQALSLHSHGCKTYSIAASLAISSGANLKSVQRMLGHASAAMTPHTYADLFEDDLDEVAMRLNDQMPLLALPSGPQIRYARPSQPQSADCSIFDEPQVAQNARSRRSATSNKVPCRGLLAPSELSECGQNASSANLTRKNSWSDLKRDCAPGGTRTPNPFLRTELLFH